MSWSAPTAYSDGKALPASDVWYYEVQWFGATSETWMPFNTDQTTALTYAVPLVCGSYLIEVRVVTTVTAAEGFTASPWAGPVTYNTGTPCPAQPPLQVQ